MHLKSKAPGRHQNVNLPAASAATLRCLPIERAPVIRRNVGTLFMCDPYLLGAVVGDGVAGDVPRGMAQRGHRVLTDAWVARLVLSDHLRLVDGSPVGADPRSATTWADVLAPNDMDHLAASWTDRRY